MRARSWAQQHTAGAALSLKRGEAKKTFPEAEAMAQSMSEAQLERFASRPAPKKRKRT
jgi:hypothetical protein